MLVQNKRSGSYACMKSPEELVRLGKFAFSGGDDGPQWQYVPLNKVNWSTKNLTIPLEPEAGYKALDHALCMNSEWSSLYARKDGVTEVHWFKKAVVMKLGGE